MKDEQWQQALGWLAEMRSDDVLPDAIAYGAVISACEKGEQWQPALGLLAEMRKIGALPVVIT